LFRRERVPHVVDRRFDQLKARRRRRRTLKGRGEYEQKRCEPSHVGVTFLRGGLNAVPYLRACVVPLAVGTNFCSRWPYVSSAYTAPFVSTSMPWTQSNSPGPQPCLSHFAMVGPFFRLHFRT